MGAVVSVTIPQLSIPFRLDGGTTPAVVEQDTPEEIAGCVLAIVLTPQGSRIELPDFGVPDSTFQQGGADPTPVEAAVNQWEPRAAAAAAADNTSLADYITNITVEVTGGTT